MPTKPNQSVDTSTANVLNAIRNDAGATYAAHIPEAYAVGQKLDNGSTVTKDVALRRLREIGQAFQTYQPELNTFLNTLVNRIGLVLITNRLYENPWAAFKRGVLEYGETVEEIFVNLIDAQQFDPDSAEYTLYKRELPNVNARFHTMNYQKFYPVTISEQQLRQAFLSYEGVSDLISKIMESLYTSANFDEFLMMKYMVCKSILEGAFYPEVLPALTDSNATQIVSAMKNISEQVTFMNTQYNEAGVATYTDKSSQYFILNTKFLSTIDVEVLARAFNLEYTQLMGHTISINSFSFSPLEEKRLINLLYPAESGVESPASLFTADEQAKLDSVPGVMVDENWMMIFDNLIMMKEAENGKGLYWNYFLHNWKTFSHSPFNTAIVFTNEENAVTGVTVSPATAQAPKNSNITFTAAVATTGMAQQGVTWSLEGGTNSYINSSGIVHIGANEESAQLTVTATSIFDPAKTGTATITITDGNTTSL